MSTSVARRERRGILRFGASGAKVKGDGWLYHGPLACALTLEAAA